MASQKRRGGGGGMGRKTEINMIPFLDVLLTLLLIFMVATPAVNRSVDVNVPNSAVSKATDTVQQKDILVVEAHSDGTFTILYNLEKYTDLSQQQFINQINRIVQARKAANQTNKDLIVQLAADKQAIYDNVIGALTILKQYGFVDVGLITKGGTSDNQATSQ